MFGQVRGNKFVEIVRTLITLIVTAFLITGATGTVMSNASALALARTSHTTRGSGAALLGAAQFLLGALVSPLVGLWGQMTAIPVGVVALSAVTVGAAMAVLARHYDAPGR